MVALLVSAWIEILRQHHSDCLDMVALLVSAWIEIAPVNIFPTIPGMSHSS